MPMIEHFETRILHNTLDRNESRVFFFFFFFFLPRWWADLELKRETDLIGDGPRGVVWAKGFFSIAQEIDLN